MKGFLLMKDSNDDWALVNPECIRIVDDNKILFDGENEKGKYHGSTLDEIAKALVKLGYKVEMV